nr:CMF_HP1_G0048140.mRNA.1.CDS.1 [Saccharomyces cerevisiae]
MPRIKVPTTFEWLAMDQFQLLFRRSPSFGENLWKKRAWKVKTALFLIIQKTTTTTTSTRRNSSSQKMLTYRAAQDLNKFLYLDGASACKQAQEVRPKSSYVVKCY